MFVHCFGTVVWMASSVWNYFIQYTGAAKQLYNYMMYTDRCYINCKSCMAVLVMFVHTLFWDCSMACTISNWDCVVCQITIETWDDILSGHDDICTDLPWICLSIALKLLLSSYKLYMGLIQWLLPVCYSFIWTSFPYKLYALKNIVTSGKCLVRWLFYIVYRLCVCVWASTHLYVRLLKIVVEGILRIKSCWVRIQYLLSFHMDESSSKTTK